MPYKLGMRRDDEGGSKSKDAGAVFSKLGSTIREAAPEIGTVVGNYKKKKAQKKAVDTATAASTSLARAWLTGGK